MTRLVVIGAAGRMGRALLRSAPEFPDLQIVGAVASAASATLGLDAGEPAGIGKTGVPITSDLASALSRADAAIDFSSPQSTVANVATCRKSRKALLIGTTGYPAELEAEFDAAARDIPLLVAPNTSLAVTLLIELVKGAAAALPARFDIEVLEAHHRMKRDAPSGTALALGRAAADGRGQPFDEAAALRGSCRQGPRSEGEIGFAVLRAGDIVGEHSVLFAGPGERLMLSHAATDRTVFARGALQAAVWLSSRPPGRYFMRDLVSYKSGS